MDITQRKMTKIAREVSKFTVRTLRADGIGTGEFDVIHVIRHNPGITQTELATALNTDKPAIARRTASLERKGYLRREPNPADGRSQLLYPTEQAQNLRNAKAASENAFYEYLLSGLDDTDRKKFLELLDILYRRSKEESRSGFLHVRAMLEASDHEKA